MKKDLLTFLVSREIPSDDLNLQVKKDIQLSFRKNVILGKFMGYQLLGAVFSLSFCPQFGVGINPVMNIARYFDQFGSWACAMFCGSLFLSSGVLVAFMGLKGEELWWVWRRYKYQITFLPVMLWSGLMLTNIFLVLPGQNFSFHFFWIVAAIMSVWIFLSARSRIYTGLQMNH